MRLRVEARRASRVPAASIVVQGALGRLGSFESRLPGRGQRATSHVDLGRAATWPVSGHRHPSRARRPPRAGVGRAARSTPTGEALVVYPRLVELGTTLFCDAGRFGSDGRRLLLRRPAGFDFHSVREYAQGESLRRVHWPTTARRGQLMVKELEDSPRDAVAVVLDCDPAGVAGTPPDSSFDAAVRAAGSVLRAYVSRGRRAVLVTTGGERVRAAGLVARRRAHRGAGRARGGRGRRGPRDRPLAPRRADAGDPRGRARRRDREPRRLLRPRRSSPCRRGGSSSVVWVDAPSYAGRPTRAATGPLQLSAAGIPVAVVRRGEDLAAALAAARRSSRS